MTILASILSQWRFGLYGLIAAALLIAGWTVNGWRNDALKLNDAKAAVREAQSRMAAAQRAAIQADEDRVSMGMKLSEAEATILTTNNQAKTIVRRVYIQSDPRCDLEPSIIRVLAATRRGDTVDQPPQQ